MSKSLITTAVVLALILPASAVLTINPTTTLAAETGNNTSAASTFAGLADGNAAAGNVSKVSTRNLLYPGSTSKIYVNFLPWFGPSDHIQVGYTSADPAQVKKQVDDMMSRGIQGVVIDWFGPGPQHPADNTTAIYMMQEAQTRGGQFEFAIMEDSLSYQACAQTLGCDVTQNVINDLNYVAQEFEPSPAYMRMNGRPVIFFFINFSAPIDWNRLRSSVQGNPLFIFRDSAGFTDLQSDGSFDWVGLNTNPNVMGLSYLDSFDATALTHPAEYPFASAYKGFNDTLASWGSNRIMNQQCGQTWLATMAETAKFYSTSTQLDAIQLVTWNDYEEGTEIETGIENCVSITGGVSSASLQWSITGQENTLDHYTVFISTDGQNLMSLGSVPPGTHSMDLSQLQLAPGTYTAFVKAVGKPGLKNHMSTAITFNTAVHDFSLNVTSAGQSGSGPQTFNTQVQPTMAGFFGTVQLSCSGLPANASCAFTPNSVLPGTSIVTSSLSILVAPTTGRNRGPMPSPWDFYGQGAGFGLLGITLVGIRRKKWHSSTIIGMAILVIWLGMLAGCGGVHSSGASSTSSTPTPVVNAATSHTVVINGSSGAISRSATIIVRF